MVVLCPIRYIWSSSRVIIRNSNLSKRAGTKQPRVTTLFFLVVDQTLHLLELLVHCEPKKRYQSRTTKSSHLLV